MLALITLVLVCVAGGYALRKTGLVRAESARDLNQIVLFLTLPPLIFVALHRSHLDPRMGVMPLIAWAATLVELVLGWAIARWISLDSRQTGSFMLALAFGNITFFGYPILTAFYGMGGLTLGILFDLPGATLAVNTVGAALASHYGGKSVDFRAQFKRLATFPPIWALALGFGLHGVSLPPTLETLLQRLGDLTTPLMLVSIGMALQFRYLKSGIGLTLLLSLLRLVVLPAVIWGVLRLMPLPHDYVTVAVMQIAMPTMFYSITLAMLFDLDTILVVNAILVTVLLSFGTLPAWHWMLAH